jgi:hypothetical protein
MFHYTNKEGYNGIRRGAQRSDGAVGMEPAWRFHAQQPPTDHPVGAYFTILPEDTPLLAIKLRIPRQKLHYLFEFAENEGLRPLQGDRGNYIYYSTDDYIVPRNRQLRSGLTKIGEEDRA